MPVSKRRTPRRKPAAVLHVPSAAADVPVPGKVPDGPVQSEDPHSFLAYIQSLEADGPKGRLLLACARGLARMGCAVTDFAVRRKERSAAKARVAAGPVLGTLLAMAACAALSPCWAADAAPDCIKSPPAHTDEDVATWTATALARAFTMDQAHPPSNRGHDFTPKGWSGWQAGLEKSGFLDDMATNGMSSAASAAGEAETMSHTGCGPGTSWSVHVPLSVVYSSQAYGLNQQMDAYATVLQGTGDALGIDAVTLK